MDKETIEAAREARNAYTRRWRAKNKDKVRDSNLRYWARRAEREAAAMGRKELDDGHTET